MIRFLVLATSIASGVGQVIVACKNPYALCAYANCTINDDNLTASCGCYSFPEPEVNFAMIDVIPDVDIREATESACSDGSCGASNVGEAPLCEMLGRNGTLWPFPHVVSTFSQRLAKENGVKSEFSWSCPAAPGRFIPVCMLAPCKFSEEAKNPYNFGTHNMTCTCPLVEADIPYNVLGGLQDPCSQDPTKPGDYVQAAGGSLLLKYQSDKSKVEAAWAAVRATLDDGVGAEPNPLVAAKSEAAPSSDSPKSDLAKSDGSSVKFSIFSEIFLLKCTFVLLGFSL